MKKLKITILLSIIFLLTLKGQDLSKEFGKVGKDDFELNQNYYNNDTEAVVLFDVGKSYFIRNENTFDIVFERTTRIKILSEAGIRWANVEIPFYKEDEIHESVYAIEAYTYNYEDSSINKTKFNKAYIYDEKVNDFWNLKKFALGNIKEGSIIEYKYKVHSQYKFNLRDWEFQWKIPVKYSEYVVKMIPFYEYTYLLQGSKGFDSYTSKIDKGLSRRFGPTVFKDVVHKFSMKDIPAFNDEEFVTSINDYIIKLDFQLSKINYQNGASVDILTTWEEMIKELLKHKDFGKYVKNSERIAPKIIDIPSLSNKSSKEKYDYVLEFVKRNYNWNQDNGKYATKSPKKFIEEKYGNCVDINLLTIGILKSVGIEAYPLLISTRDHGKIKYNYPYSHFFNYVLIYANVDGEKIISDATEINCLNNRIPTRCINDRGLIINENKVEWAKLGFSFPSEIKTEIVFESKDSNEFSSTISVASTEYDALYYRNNYGDNIENIKNKLESPDYIVNDLSISVQNQQSKDKPYILNYELKKKLNLINNKIYLNPFLNNTISNTHLKQKKRTYPIDMTYPKKRVFKSTIIVPDGYKIDFIPNKQRINNHLFEQNYTTIVKDNEIILTFDYYFKKSIYSPKEYPKIKFYYNEAVKKGNEKIVFSKINK